jgi:hypothetical protein
MWHGHSSFGPFCSRLTSESYLHGGLIPTVDCYRHLYMLFHCQPSFISPLSTGTKRARHQAKRCELAGRGRLFSVGFGFGLPPMTFCYCRCGTDGEPKRDGLLTALKEGKISSSFCIFIRISGRARHILSLLTSSSYRRWTIFSHHIDHEPGEVSARNLGSRQHLHDPTEKSDRVYRNR